MIIMFNTIEKWIARNFKVINAKQAVKWGLQYLHGVYGDEINRRGCRSIWIDKKGRKYRVHELSAIENKS